MDVLHCVATTQRREDQLGNARGFGTPRLQISSGFILLSFFLLFPVMKVFALPSLMGENARGEWGRDLPPGSSKREPGPCGSSVATSPHRP